MAVKHTVKVNNTEVYIHQMYEAIDNYIIEHDGIDLVKDVTQYQWKSVLYYIHDNVFPDRDMLKRADRVNNAYDFDLLNDIYDIYKRLCMEYNKITMLADYAILTGIDDGIISTWNNAGYRGLNPKASNLQQKIMRDNEGGVSTMMISSGRNPVGYMAILNHYHGWNLPSATNGETEKRRTVTEIANAHNIPLEDKQNTVPAASFVQIDDKETTKE